MANNYQETATSKFLRGEDADLFDDVMQAARLVCQVVEEVEMEEDEEGDGSWYDVMAAKRRKAIRESTDASERVRELAEEILNNWLELGKEDYDTFPLPSMILERSAEGATAYLGMEADSGDIDVLDAILPAFVKRAKYVERWGFTWCTWCDKARPDQFTGGAVLISKETTEYVSASNAVDAFERRPDVAPCRVTKVEEREEGAHDVWVHLDADTLRAGDVYVFGENRTCFRALVSGLSYVTVPTACLVLEEGQRVAVGDILLNPRGWS